MGKMEGKNGKKNNKELEGEKNFGLRIRKNIRSGGERGRQGEREQRNGT